VSGNGGHGAICGAIRASTSTSTSIMIMSKMSPKNYITQTLLLIESISWDSL
jgi:hypothetical protein